MVFGNLMKTKVMKRLVYLGLILITGLSFNTFAQESDSTGMPGDNFDLQAALDLFKQSKNLQDFEKKLNTESNGVNNLDQDGKNVIDYNRVIDKKDRNNHAILLQIPVNKKETKDLAAIAIEKRGDAEAQLQIICNDVLYGEEKIMEPIEEREIKKPRGPATLNSPTAVFFVNVWYWPCIQYIYDPFYDPWYSPYYWDYYPSWWSPWRPVYYYVYYQRVYYYHGWCQYTTVYHVPNAHRIYAQNSSNSASVRSRYAPQQAAYKARSVNNQSANGTKGRIEPGKTETINSSGRTNGKKIETTRPATNTEPKKVKREQPAPRPINSNNRGNVNNGGTNKSNNGTTRTVEPAKKNPTTAPQQRPVERSPQRVQPQPRPVEKAPQRVQPQPQRQQPVRQVPQNRPVNRPSNGGGRRP